MSIDIAAYDENNANQVRNNTNAQEFFSLSKTVFTHMHMKYLKTKTLFIIIFR